MATTLSVDTDGVSGTYSTLAAAIAAVPDPLTDDYIIECAATTGAADTTAVSYNGQPGIYSLTIRAAAGHRAGASWDTNKYRLDISTSWTAALTIGANAVGRVEGIQVGHTGASGPNGISVSSSDWVIDSCYCRGTQGGNQGVYLAGGNNTVVVNTYSVGWNHGFNCHNQSASYLYNCVAANNVTSGVRVATFKGMTARNCYAGGNGTDLLVEGSGSLTVSNVLTADGSQSTTTAAYATASGTYFANVTAGSEDFTITADSALYDAGADLSADATYAFSTDIAGTARSGTWDIGPYELAAAAAPVLSSPTSASVTQTGATIGATTDDATGTLYGVVTTSASAPSATQIKAGQDHTGSAAAGSGSNASLSVGANTIAITGLTAATTYYYYLVQDNGADSNVVNGTFTTAVAAPTLTSPTAASIGTTTVTPRVTTDTGNGTCYYVITPQAEGEPSNTQVEAGTNAAGGSPVASGSQVVSASGVITFSEVTGLTAGTAYRISYAHSGTPS